MKTIDNNNKIVNNTPKEDKQLNALFTMHDRSQKIILCSECKKDITKQKFVMIVETIHEGNRDQTSFNFGELYKPICRKCMYEWIHNNNN